MRKSFPSDDPWSAPELVARFAVSPGNDVLHRFAVRELSLCQSSRLLDIGCGAGSNALPLAAAGWQVMGLDRSPTMLQAAKERVTKAGLSHKVRFKLATMDDLPVNDESFDFIVAHGIWNLAGSAEEFRRGVSEAARVAKPGAALFVYTFSRSSLPADTVPLKGEPFTFVGKEGQAQCFLTPDQLIDELESAGFSHETGTTITEYPRQKLKPAILEGIFRRKTKP